MSTKIEPNGKFVAHDEKSKFLIFFVQRYPVVALKTWWYFFSRNILLNATKKNQKVRAPHCVKNTQIDVTHTFKYTSLCLIRIS